MKSPSIPTREEVLDAVLCGFSPHDPFTIRDACQGVAIFGETGSGKTSGSGQFLAHSYLSANFGGLILTVNPDEADRWREYAARAGRADDIVFFGPTHPHSFNFFQHEAQNPSQGVGVARHLADLFQTLAEIDESRGSKGGTNEGFWRRELDKMVIHGINLLRFAGEDISLPLLYDIVITAPESANDLLNETKCLASFCMQSLEKLKKRQEMGEIASAEMHDCEMAKKYWESEYPTMDDRPRTSVRASFTGIALNFLSGKFADLFCGKTTLVPELCFDGQIIVIDIPVKLHSTVGIFAQVVFKYCWQKAVERRRLQPNSRPVFLWADEAQYFVNSHDVLFQSTARSSLVCTVYLTQNLPSYTYALGERGKSLAHALLGNLTTTIFHRNNCIQTNEYASELFAKSWQATPTTSVSEKQGKAESTYTTHEQLREQIIPLAFTALPNGGKDNDYTVEGIVHRGGRIFEASGCNAGIVIFNQRP